MMSMDNKAEWLEPDGIGGFASGTVTGVRTRRYHAMLSTATTPPTGRMVLVNGFDAWVEKEKEQRERETNNVSGEEPGPHGPAAREFLTRQRYAPDVVAPENAAAIESFTNDPWPTWTYRLRDGTRIEQEIFVTRGSPITAIRWCVRGAEADGATLSV